MESRCCTDGGVKEKEKEKEKKQSSKSVPRSKRWRRRVDAVA